MHIIVNPAAAGGRLGRQWPRLERQLVSAGFDTETIWTRAPGHAAEIAEGLVRSGETRLAVAGGDGTVCEAVEGLYRAGGGELVILPLGTGNDGARTLGIPSDLAAAAKIGVEGVARRVDLIRIDGHVVFNAIGVGMTGDINERAAKLKQARLPWVRGIVGYLVATLSALFRYRRRPVRMVTPEQIIEASMLILAVHGGPTTGGGFNLTPQAVPDDGLLDACLVEEVGPVGRLRRLVAAMRGRLGEQPGSHELQAPWLELHFDRPLPTHLDGNAYTLKPPVARFEVLPGALEVVVPQD